jgi:hypothetical protein
MGVPEYTEHRRSVEDEPYLGEKQLIEGASKFQPFPEAVVADPVLAGRRRSHVGTFGDNESLEEFYEPIDAFEGKHRYDPKFEWDKKEETRLVRKVTSTYHPFRDTS